MFLPKAAAFTAKEEGFRGKMYKDTKGILTIGYGFNLEALEMPDSVAFLWMQILLEECAQDLRRLFPKFDTFSANRQTALLDIRYNLGARGLRGFPSAVRAVNADNWTEAIAQFKYRKPPSTDLSGWYTDHIARSERVLKLLEG